MDSKKVAPTSATDSPKKDDSVFVIQAPPESSERNTIALGITAAFAPLHNLMWVLFRFPFIFKQSPNGSFSYTFSHKSPGAIGFLIVNVLLTIILILNIINYFGLLLNFPAQKPHQFVGSNNRSLHNEELYLIHRNNSEIITIFAQLVHVVFSGWAIYLKHELVAKYLSFWSSAADMMYIDVAFRVKKYVLLIVWIYFAINFMIISVTISHFIPVTSGAPAMMAVLTIRLFEPEIHIDPNFGIYRSIFAVILIYVRISSNVYFLFFYFESKLLTNALREWNVRLRTSLWKGQNVVESKTYSGVKQYSRIDDYRTDLTSMFKDYVCIVDLIEGTDRVFSTIIETYYGCQVLSTCFQFYHLYSTCLNKTEFHGIRHLDVLAMILYLVQSISVLFFASKAAAEVGLEAIEGIELLRSKGYMGRKTDDEAYFMLSMFVSYSGHSPTALTGGKFFVIDRPFLLAIAASIFTYLILIVQFTYIFNTNYQDDLTRLTLPNNSKKLIQLLLDHVEASYQFVYSVREYSDSRKYSKLP